MSRPQSSEMAPPELPGYRFIRHLGAGGNAQVYLYEQDLPRREVAVKVLNDSALSEAARRLFTAEANVTAGLAHRHIVQVFDAKVTDNGRPYIVMPYYAQPNLSVRARRAHFSVAEVLRIGIQVGGAVETSHRRGVMHRDIKPQNILTDSYGEPALTDFGIAATKGGDGPEGLSVPWSPPEILYGTEPGDERSDVYSLGATLWHVLVGRSPFEQPGGDNKPFALMSRIKSDPAPPTARADVPDSLERLLRQTMAKDPAARPQTAIELIRGLQTIEQELRLPVTQPILPTMDPAGDTPGGDTVSPPAARTGETTFGRGYGRDPGNDGPRRPATDSRDRPAPPPWGGVPRDATMTRGSRPAAAWPAPASPPAAGGPARPAWPGADAVPGESDDPTRIRGPRRLDPWNPAPGGPEQQTRAGDPMRSSPWTPLAGGGSGGRAVQFPQEAPEPVTLARPRAIAPGGGAHARPSGSTATRAAAGHEGHEDRGKPRRMLALAGAGVLLAVVIGVAALALSHGGSGPSSALTAGSQPSQPGVAQDALGPGPTAPVVTARSVGGDEVEFSWHYNNSAPADSFRVQVNGGSGQPATPTKPDLVLRVAQGQRVCVQVQVISAHGVESPQSSVSCWPES